MSRANYRGRGIAPRGFGPRGPAGPCFPPPNFISNRGKNVDTSPGWIDNHSQPWQQTNRPQANHFEQKPWRDRPPNLWRGHDNHNRGGQNRRVNGRSRGNTPTSFVLQNGCARGFGSERGPRPGIRGGPTPGYTVRRVAGCKFAFGPPRQPAPRILDSPAVPALGSEEERQQKIAETAYNLKQKLSTSTVHDLNLYWKQNFQAINNTLVEQPGSSNHAIPEQQLHPPQLGLTSNNLQDTKRVDLVRELTQVISKGGSYFSEENEKAAVATNTVESILETSDFNESTSWRDPAGNNSSRSTTPKTSEETELYLPPAFDPRGPPPVHNIIEHHPEKSHPTCAYYPHHVTSLNTAPPHHASFIPTLPFNSSGSAMPYQKQNELQPLPMTFNPQYQATGCHSSNLVPIPPLDNRLISSGAINSRLIESSLNADLSNSLQPTGYAPLLGTTYNSSIHLPTAVPCIVRDLAPVPLMVTSTSSMLEPMPNGIFNIPVLSSKTNHDSSVPLHKASSPNMNDELDDMQEALKFAKTQLNMKCEQNSVSNESTIMPFDLVSPASSQQLLPPPPKKNSMITAPPAPYSNKNASLKLDSQPTMVELQKKKSENTTSVPLDHEVSLPNSPGGKVAVNPIEVRSSVDSPPQVKAGTDATTIQNLLLTLIPVRQVDKINSPTKIECPAICTDIRKQPDSVGSDVIVNGCKKTYRAKINQDRPKCQQLEQAVSKKSQNLVTRSPNKKHVLHLEARSMLAAGSSKKVKSSTPLDVNWKEKVISRFLKMSKNDIYNMVNSSGLRKFDVAMQHLVKEKKNSLSRERRSSADDMIKGCDMLREEFMSELGAMLDPSAVVDIENLPATFLQHLSEVLKLNDEPPLIDDMENSLKSRLADDENARHGNFRLQEGIDDIEESTNENTSVDRYTSLQPDDVSSVNTTVTRGTEAVKLPKRTKAAKRIKTDCPKNVRRLFETSLDVIKMHRVLPGESSAKNSDRIVNSQKNVDPDPHTTVQECTLRLGSELFTDLKSAELATRVEKRNASITGLTVTNLQSKSLRPMTEESIFARLKKVERWNRQHCFSIDSYRNLTKEEWEEKYGKTIKNLTDKESISTHSHSISSSRDTSHERSSPSPKSSVVSESSGLKKLDPIHKVCYVDKAAETEPTQVPNNVNEHDACTQFQNPTSESTSSDASNSSKKQRSRQKKKRKLKDSKEKKRETSKRTTKRITKDGKPSSEEKLLTLDEIKKELPVKIENIKEEFSCPERLGNNESLSSVERSKKLALVGQSNKDETLPAPKKTIPTVQKSHPLEIALTCAENTELSETQTIGCEPTQMDQTNISLKEYTTVETHYFESAALEHKEILPNSMEVASQQIDGVAKSTSRSTVPPEDKQKSKLLKLAPSISQNKITKLLDAIQSTLIEDKDSNKSETNTSNNDTKDSNDTPTFIMEHVAEMPTDKATDLPLEQPRDNLAAEQKLANCFVVPNSVEIQPVQLTKSGSKKIGIETYKSRVLQRVTGKIGKTSTSESRVQVSTENLQNIPNDYKEILYGNEAAPDYVEPKRAADTEQNAAAVQKNNVGSRVDVKKSKTVTQTNEAKVAGYGKQPMLTVDKNEPKTVVREEHQKTVVQEENSKATVRDKYPKAAVHEEQPKTVVLAKQPRTSAPTNEAETVIQTNKPEEAAFANETRSTVHSNQPKMTVHAHRHNPHDPKRLPVGNSSTTHHTQKRSISSDLKHGMENKSGVKCTTKDTLLISETHGDASPKPAKISKTVGVGYQTQHNDSNKLNVDEKKESGERKITDGSVCLSENQKLSATEKKHSLRENSGTPEHGISTGSPSDRTVAPIKEHDKSSSKSSTQDNFNLICNSKKHSKREVLDKKFGKKHSWQERSSKEKLSAAQSPTIDDSVPCSWSRPGPLSFKKSSKLKKQESHRLSKIQSKITEYLKSNDTKTKIGINLNPVVRLVRIVLPCRKSKSLIASESEKTVVNVDNMLLEMKPSEDFDGIQAAERSNDRGTERLQNDSEIEMIVNSSKQDELISAHTPETEEPPTTTIESGMLSVPIDVAKQNTVDKMTEETVNCAKKLDEMSGIANNYDSRLPNLRCISATSSCNQQEDIETSIELSSEVELGQAYYDSKHASAMKYSEIDVVHEEISNVNLANVDAVDMTPLPAEVITDIQLSELEDNESIDIDIVEATGESTEFLLYSEMQRNSDQQCATEFDKFSFSLQSSDELGYTGICPEEPWITEILHNLIDEVSNRWNASTSTEYVPIEVKLEPAALNKTEISSVHTGNQSLKNQPLSPELINNTDRNDIESLITTFKVQIDTQKSEKAALVESTNIDYAVSDKFSNNDSVVADKLIRHDEVTDGELANRSNIAEPDPPVNSISPLEGFSDEYIQSNLLGQCPVVESIEESCDNSTDDISEKRYQNFEKNELSETKTNFLGSMTTSEIVGVITENSLTKGTEETSTDIDFRSNEMIHKSDSTNEVDISYQETLRNEPLEKQSDNTEEFQSLEVVQPNVQENFGWLQFTTESKTLVRMEKDTNDGKIKDVAKDECKESDVDTDDSLDFENGEFIVVSEVASDQDGSIDKRSLSRQEAENDESATRKSLTKRIKNRVIQSIRYSSTADMKDPIDETSPPKTSLFDPIHKSSQDSNSHDTTNATDLQAEQISKVVSPTKFCMPPIDLETSTLFDNTVNDVVPREEVRATNDNSATAVEDACIFESWMDEYNARNSTKINTATESIEGASNLIDNTENEEPTSSNDHEEMKKLPCESMPTKLTDGLSETREEATVQLGDQTSFVVEVNEPCNNNTSKAQNQSIINGFAANDIDSNDTEQQSGTADDREGRNIRIDRALKGQTLYVKWDKSSVAANLNRSESAGISRFLSSQGKTRDRLYKSERKIKHKKRNNLKLATAKVDEAMKSQEVVTTVKSQDVVKSMRKPTTKESVMARMIEIDVEIHTLMSEKMKLYEMLESGSFSDAQTPPVIDDAELSGNVQTQTMPRCKTPVAIMKKIINHLESDHATTGDARSTIISNEGSVGESTKKSSSLKLKKPCALRRKIEKRDKNTKSSSKIEARKLKGIEFQELKDPINNKQHGSTKIIGKSILKKKKTVEKSAEDRSRSTVNWESGSDDSVNDRPVEQLQLRNNVLGKKAARGASDKNISRIFVSNENWRRQYPFSNNRKRSRQQKRLKLKPVLRCTLTNEEEEMPLDKLYNEIIQRQSNSVGGTGDHLTEIINAVAEDKVNQYEISSSESRKESDVSNASPNVSRPDLSSSNEPAATPNEKVDEYPNQIQCHGESRRSVANGNSTVARDDLADLQTFDDIGGDLTFGNRKMIGSIDHASSQNNNYNIPQTAESVTEKKSQDNWNDETRRMSESENRLSLKSDVLPEPAMDTRVAKQQSFTHIPPISDSVMRSHRGSINLEIIEAGINAFNSILGKVVNSDKSEKKIPSVSFADQARSFEDTSSEENGASVNREVMKAFDQNEDLTGESTLENIRQRKIEDADRNSERSHLRRNSAKYAREALIQQSAPTRAAKSRERTSFSPIIRMLNSPNELNDSEGSHRRGKKRKMTQSEMANCKVWLIDCKYTYLNNRSFRRSSERSQLSRNDPEVDHDSEKPFEAIESNIDSNVGITKTNSDFLRKNTSSTIRRGESLLPLTNENVNISETTWKPKIQDDTAKRSIETDNAETGDDCESSYPPKFILPLKGYRVNDSNDSQINPNPRALRSVNKSKKAKIRTARSTSSALKLTNFDQFEEITNCQLMIASEYLGGRVTQTTINTVDISQASTSNTGIGIVKELAPPRNNEIQKSNNDSLRCSGSADVIDVEPPRIQYTAHKGPILDIKVFHDSFLAASEDGTIYRYSQKSEEVLNTYQGHKSAVTCMCIVKITTGVPKTDLLFSGSLDASLRCFDIKSGEEVQDMSYVGSAVQCMDQAWGMIFLGTNTGFVSRFNVMNNSFEGEPIPFSKESVLALKATTEGPRRVLIAASRHQPITIRDAHDGLLVRTVNGHRTHTVYSLMMHNNLVYCGTSSTAIPVFDFINGSQVTLYNAGMGIVCIQMYQELLFAGCYDGNIYVFDTKEQKIVCSIPGPGNMLLSMGIVQNKVIAGSKDRRLHIWQIPKQVQTLLR